MESLAWEGELLHVSVRRCFAPDALRGMPVPVSETIWRGKVGTPEKCACIVIEPVSGVPVSGVYCTSMAKMALCHLDGIIIT